jgi:hypothetical protein
MMMPRYGLKIVLEGWLGPKGTRAAFFIGFVIGFLGGLWFLLKGSFIGGALFFYFTTVLCLGSFFNFW